MKNDKFTVDLLSSASTLCGASQWQGVIVTTPTCVYACQLLGWVAGSPLSASKPLCKPAQPRFRLCSNITCSISSPSQRGPRLVLPQGRRDLWQLTWIEQRTGHPPGERKTICFTEDISCSGGPGPTQWWAGVGAGLEITQDKAVQTFSQEKRLLSQMVLALSAPRTPGSNLEGWHLRAIFLQQIQTW